MGGLENDESIYDEHNKKQPLSYRSEIKEDNLKVKNLSSSVSM
jgi:hypothetical protein